jgi:hypothetical protein
MVMIQNFLRIAISNIARIIFTTFIEVLVNYLNAKFSTEEQFCRRVKKLDEFESFVK